MIDVSKVKAGDELEFHRVKVVKIDKSSVPFRIEWQCGEEQWFTAHRFARHIPARPFEKGDPVTWGDGTPRATFLMSHGGMAFIAHEDDSPGTAELSALRHADAAPEDEIVVTEEEAAAFRADIISSGRRTTEKVIDSYRAVLTDFLKRRKEAGR
jgi:hypothetical protein